MRRYLYVLIAYEYCLFILYITRDSFWQAIISLVCAAIAADVLRRVLLRDLGAKK